MSSIHLATTGNSVCLLRLAFSTNFSWAVLDNSSYISYTGFACTFWDEYSTVVKGLTYAVKEVGAYARRIFSITMAVTPHQVREDVAIQLFAR